MSTVFPAPATTINIVINPTPFIPSGFSQGKASTILRSSDPTKFITNTLVPANIGQSGVHLTSFHPPSITSTITAEDQDQSSNKDAAAGAAIGGIFGILFGIATALFMFRWWLRKKRVKRTNKRRGSLYYGGDAGGTETNVPSSTVYSLHHEVSHMLLWRFPAYGERNGSLSRSNLVFLHLRPRRLKQYLVLYPLSSHCLLGI
jgi:hypothetical protein